MFYIDNPSYRGDVIASSILFTSDTLISQFLNPKTPIIRTSERKKTESDSTRCIHLFTYRQYLISSSHLSNHFLL